MMAPPSWAERTVRHFGRLLVAFMLIVLVTEVVALTGLVPHLRPVSLRDITTNILFAIGFGCPLVLYLSSLPPWREALAAVIAGTALAALLSAVQFAAGLPSGLAQEEVIAAQGIIGLGLAAAGALAFRALRTTGAQRTAALVYLLPAGVALLYTIEAGIFLEFVKDFFPKTRDGFAYAADAGFGFQPSFAVGMLFAQMPLLRWICFAIYVAPPPALVYVYALQVRSRRPPPVDVITVLLVAALVGYACYFLYPVCGPAFAFKDAFPSSPPPAGDYLGRELTITDKIAWPNGMPSLHMASVLLAAWYARPYGRWARFTATVFVLGTFLATLGLGEHYLVDLVVAWPFTLAICAACTPSRPGLVRARNAALAGSLALVAIWYVLLYGGVSLLLSWPALTWGVALLTLSGTGALKEWLFGAITNDARPGARQAPGPRGNLVLGNLQKFRRDVLGLLMDGHRQHGDVVRFHLGPILVHSVAHPDHVRHVLLTHHDNYDKDTRSSAKIRSITGEGLLTANGAFWLRQRRLIQPTFSPQRLARFTDVMTQSTAQMLAQWKKVASEGRPLDVAREMTALTFTIVGKALFGADLGGEAETVERAATQVLEHTWRRLEKLVETPQWFPSAGNRRFRQGMQELDRIVYRLIAERRQAGHTSNDLLSLLLLRHDEDTGERLTDHELRTETLTLLLAGHETTANALTWTWYLLWKHSDVRRRVAAEVAEVLGGRAPTAEDLPRLNYTAMVVKEALRVYPPIWIMERRVLADDTIGGYAIPARSSVVISPYVIHRDPRFWDNPDSFYPDRFAPGATPCRDPHAYLPFGLGQRLCIGNHFALMEAQVIIAMVTQAFRLDLVPGEPVEPKPGITLRTRHGLPMSLRTPE